MPCFVGRPGGGPDRQHCPHVARTSVGGRVMSFRRLLHFAGTIDDLRRLTQQLATWERRLPQLPRLLAASATGLRHVLEMETPAGADQESATPSPGWWCVRSSEPTGCGGKMGIIGFLNRIFAVRIVRAAIDCETRLSLFRSGPSPRESSPHSTQ